MSKIGNEAAPRCLVGVTMAANERIEEGREWLFEALDQGTMDEEGRLIVHCGKCKADLAISARPDGKGRMKLSSEPENPDDQCLSVKLGVEDQWTMKLGEWFDMRLVTSGE